MTGRASRDGVRGPAPAQAPASSPTGARRGWTRGVWYNFYRLSARRAEAEPDVRAHIALFARTGVNALYVLVKTPDGYAHFASTVCPRRPGQDWDPLAFTVAECRNIGIAVYPYLNVFCDGRGVKGQDPQAYLNRFPRHVEVSDNGRSTHWLAPGIPEVRAYQRDIVLEVAERYDIDGIQLDRVRYGSRGDDEEGAGGTPGYNPIAIARYREEARRAPDESDPRWLGWRREQVTAFVRECRGALKAVKPGLDYGAAVFPDVVASPRNQFQDWARWVRQGLLDTVCPMNYATDDASFASRLQGALMVTRGRAHLHVGTGLSMSGMSPERAAAQIRLCRRRGADGVVLFNGYCLLDPAMARAVKDAWLDP